MTARFRVVAKPVKAMTSEPNLPERNSPLCLGKGRQQYRKARAMKSVENAIALSRTQDTELVKVLADIVSSGLRRSSPLSSKRARRARHLIRTSSSRLCSHSNTGTVPSSSRKKTSSILGRPAPPY